MDTVRADHVSCYGYPLATTPSIDALAASADRYTQARATAPWTLPSHASMFTGSFPFEHGARDGIDADGEIYDARPLAGEHVTLAEALSDAGFRTAAFMANTAYLAPRFGLDQGFEVYDVERAPAPAMNAKLFQWIDGLGDDEPFFACVNYMDAHRPYDVEPLPPERESALPAPSTEPAAELLDALYEEVLGAGAEPNAGRLAKLVSQYDHGLARIDLAVGDVVARLRARGAWDRTLLIVVSDHGEYFGEHRLLEHSKDVYEPVVSVPLLVKRPNQAEGRVIDARTSLAELPRLVFDALPRWVARAHGGAFALDGEPRPVLSEIHFTRPRDLARPWKDRFRRERVALYADRYKFILSSDGDDELFDLANDPDEQCDLCADEPEIAGALERRLKGFLASRAKVAPAAAPVRVPIAVLGGPLTTSEDERDELKHLGY